MISKRTVLILGAGASQPYGYPLHAEFKEEILRKLEDKASRTELSEHYGYSDFLIGNFASSFRWSGVDNIEEFLAARSEFGEIGKIAIAESILSREDKDILFRGESWYQYLYDAMNDSFESFAENKISFITFNFDRSLETFLFESLKNSYGKPEAEVVQRLKKIPVIHLRGQIWSLSRQGALGYGQQPSRTHILDAAKEIFIPEGLEPDSRIEAARSILEDAEIIAFLGFGYDEGDMKRLGISELQGKTILGSTFGLKPGEIRAIASRSGGKISFPKTKIAQSLDALGFLKESGILGL